MARSLVKGSAQRPRAPHIQLEVTQVIAEESAQRDSAHCMIAEAVKRAVPDARHVSVDVQTIRYTDPKKNLRYTYLTPRVAQVAIIKFDQGEVPEPFSVRLSGGHVTLANMKTRRKAGKVKEGSPAQKEAWARASETAREALKSDPPREAEPDPDPGDDPLRKTVIRGQGDAAIPRRVGGRTPPVVPGGRRRQFGLRAFDRPQ